MIEYTEKFFRRLKISFEENQNFQFSFFQFCKFKQNIIKIIMKCKYFIHIF